jgi:hypothetical protein
MEIASAACATRSLWQRPAAAAGDAEGYRMFDKKEDACRKVILTP